MLVYPAGIIIKREFRHTIDFFAKYTAFEHYPSTDRKEFMRNKLRNTTAVFIIFLLLVRPATAHASIAALSPGLNNLIVTFSDAISSHQTDNPVADSISDLLTLGMDYVFPSYDGFDDYLERFTEAYHIPGMAVSVATKNSTVFSGVYGECTSENDRFFIGSESKSFTALAIMQLYEAGLINLTDPVSDYIADTEYPVKGIEKNPITIKMLLNQTSGFSQFQRPHEREITASYGRFSYSNANYEILGEIIEKVSGLSYEDYMREHIFKPLGMNNTIANAKKAVEQGMLGGHRSYLGLSVASKDIIPEEGSWFHEPAGYIASTGADMTKYLQMYLREGLSETGERILSAENIRKMYTQTAKTTPGNPEYGYGLMAMQENGLTFVSHDGLTEEYRTYFLFVPRKDIAVSVMINGEDYLVGNGLTDDICRSLYNIAIGEAPADIRNSKFYTGHWSEAVKYLTVVALAIWFTVEAVKRHRNYIRHKDSDKITLKNQIVFLSFEVAATALILPLTHAFSGTPVWVIRDYVPDVYLLLVLATVIAGIGALASAGLVTLIAVSKKRK